MTRLPLLACLLAGAALPALAQDGPLPAPEFLGEIVLPSALSLGGVTIGGLSDIAYDAESDRFLVISDDRTEHGPARYYEIRLGLNEDHIALDLLATHEIFDSEGASFALRGADPEGIAHAGDRLFWSSERDADGVPGIFVFDGEKSSAITLPAAYIPNADGTFGTYNNLGFEGLTLSADGSQLIAANENALAQDGPKATHEAGSPARILVIDTATLEPVAEYLYQTEAIYTEATLDPFWADNGVSAIESLPDGRLVVVERSFALGYGNTIRLYVADLTGAENILGQDRIDAAAVTPVAKEFWFQIDEGDFGLDIDNIESFAFGPAIDGRQSFVIVSDDNFNAATQFTQFAVFTIPAL